MKKLLFVFCFIFLGVTLNAQFRALWFEGSQYFQLGDSVVTVWGADTLPNSQMVRGLITSLSPGIKSDSSTYSDTAAYASTFGDSIYVSGQDVWIKAKDTINKVDTADFAVNAQPDTLFHEDTQVWLSSGDTIPKADSTRDVFTANDTVVTPRVKATSSLDITANGSSTIDIESPLNIFAPTIGITSESSNLILTGANQTILDHNIGTFDATMSNYFISQGDTIEHDDDSLLASTVKFLVKAVNALDSIVSAYGKFDSLSIGGGDILTTSDTISLKQAVEEETFDSLNTKQLRITDSVLIVEDMPNRVEKYEVYYNPTTNKITASEVVHAYTAFEDSSVAISTSTTWAQVTNASDSLFGWIEQDGITDAQGDTALLSLTGHYNIPFSIIGEGSNGITYQLRLYNATQTEGIMTKTAWTGRGAANDGPLTGIAYCINCNAGDKIVMQIRQTSGSGSFTVKDGYMFFNLKHTE